MAKPQAVSKTAHPGVEALARRFIERTAKIGVIGLGYVGLPLVCAICDKGFSTTGFDIDDSKVEKLRLGQSYITNLHSSRIKTMVDRDLFFPTSDFSRLSSMDAIVICVPTPLTPQRDPDLSYVVETTKTIAAHLQPGQLVILESTTYPGTVRDVMKPILEEGGLVSGRDFYLAFSPEREDPGNKDFTTSTIPKVVGGDGADALHLAKTMYDQFLVKTVPVSSPETAEAVKLTENIFRAVNIALVNELKLVYEALGVDIWEVIEAAKTKPFGYMPFYPGPGLGGHCIPIDPFYLTWKAREYNVATRFIELAGEINVAMPRHVVNRLAETLNLRAGKGLRGSKILILGVAYKKDVSDTRESPAFAIMDLLRAGGAELSFHDPFVDEIPALREHPHYQGFRSAALSAEILSAQDAVVIVTDHSPVDYAFVLAHAPLVIDTRNKMTGQNEDLVRERVVKA